jgi:hypothetical protein
MKARFWNVQIEISADGTVKAAVIRSREAEYQPSVQYKRDQWREVFSLWYETEAAAQGAVIEAKAMEKKERVVA